MQDDESPHGKAKRARVVWLEPHPDMKTVEAMYRTAVSSFLPASLLEKEGQPIAAGKKRRLDKETNEQVPCLEDWQRLSVEQFCMILCQSGRSDEAKPYLQKLGYVCRLATCVLDYPSEKANDESSIKSTNKSQGGAIGCHVWDNFLSQNKLQHLRDVFEDPQADYWPSHKYQVEPPSPYFSYLVPLVRLDKGASITVDAQFGCLGDIVTNLHHRLLPHFPKLSGATTVELWAHNRPHPTGHQFHFDSDNEGQGRMIKNPIMTAILYLSAPSSSSENSGGPSIVTNQALVSQHLASKAVVSVSTSPGRVIAFDGSLLHGVIPGKGSHSGNRRVTLMLAFWKRIRVRPGDKPGAARPFPFPKSPSIENKAWNRLLVRPSKTESETDKPNPIARDPIALDRVYETLDGQKWTKAMGFPEYDHVFQGF